MLKKIEETKGKISAVYYCLHAQEDNCSCRKPKTGLIKKALAQLKIKSEKSREVFFIGDDMRDVHTGKNADLRTILVLSGREKLKNQKKWTLRPDYVFQDLCQAVDFILSL
jgi:D-glycero-D-manno-heptose 1,7-bisphosphate phosphatase